MEGVVLLDCQAIDTDSVMPAEDALGVPRSILRELHSSSCHTTAVLTLSLLRSLSFDRCCSGETITSSLHEFLSSSVCYSVMLIRV